MFNLFGSCNGISTVSKVYAFCHGYFYFYFIFKTERELVMVLLKCVTYAPHCMHRCKRETSLSAISILRGIPQAKKGYRALDFYMYLC